MHDYQFSTIKIAPQSAHRAPIAVGVILYDPKKGEVYRRFTDNWDEVRRRTGLATLPDIRSVTDEGPIKVGDDYLANLSANQFPDTLLVTLPCNLMPFDTPLDALEWTFGTHVGLPPRLGGGPPHWTACRRATGAQDRGHEICGRLVQASVWVLARPLPHPVSPRIPQGRRAVRGAVCGLDRLQIGDERHPAPDMRHCVDKKMARCQRRL